MSETTERIDLNHVPVEMIWKARKERAAAQKIETLDQEMGNPGQGLYTVYVVKTIEMTDEYRYYVKANNRQEAKQIAEETAMQERIDYFEPDGEASACAIITETHKLPSENASGPAVIRECE